MQITKEIINNPEMRSHLSEAFSSLRSRLTSSKLKTILLVSVISFTSLLVRQTLQVQHSCNPMIHWSGELPAECQVAVNTNSDSFDDFSYPRRQELKSPKHKQNIAQEAKKSELKYIDSESKAQSNRVSRLVDEHPNDVVGGIVGVAGGLATVAAAGATSVFSMPVAGAVAIGLGLWFLIRSTLK